MSRINEPQSGTTQQLRDKEFATALKLARTDSPEGDISSGKALNVLLDSIQRGSQLNLAQSPPLDEDTLKHINLTGAGASGNIGMLKDVTNLSWPEALREPGFDDTRKNLNKNLIQAVTVLKDGDPVPDGTLKDIRADYKTLNEKVNDGPDELSASQYIESRRFLNQLNQSIKALGDRNVVKHFSKNSTWTAKGKNVAELVAQLNKEGLTFAPAAPGDQGAYKALYLSMRQFETALASAQAPK